VNPALRHFAAAVLAVGGSLGIAGPIATSAEPAPTTTTTQKAETPHVEPADNPVADPKAVVMLGNARFTVLTPQLIRMEWSADGKFEDHASLVFINRRLPVPKFHVVKEGDPSYERVGIYTDALKLTYTLTTRKAGEQQPDNIGFAAENLKIALTVDNREIVWHPGDKNSQNLQGTTRTLDGALGSKTREPIEQGLVSRSGWALVDDSTRPLFDSADFRFLEGEKSPWPWVMERPASEQPGKYVDWYFFGYGHDYRKALGDYVRVAGRIPLPPRFAFGTWWSRYGLAHQ